MPNVHPLLKQLFSSKIRVKILSHFFFHPGEDFHVRRVASLIAEPAGVVGRELGHLEEGGILKSRRVGNQKRYAVQTDSPIIDDLRNIFIKTTGAGAELKATLEKTKGIELAFIFGSYASGEAGEKSDLDLMVIGDVPDRELAGTVSQIEQRLEREINYSIYPRGEVEIRIGREGDFLHEVFSGPVILLIGEKSDRLFQTA